MDFRKQEPNSHLLQVNFYFVLSQFQIKIAKFSLVFPTYIIFCTQISVIRFFTPFSSQILSSPRKVSPYAPHQPVHCFQVLNN